MHVQFKSGTRSFSLPGCSAAYTTGSVWLSDRHGVQNKKILWELSPSSQHRKTVIKRKDRLLADLLSCHITTKKSMAGRGRSVRKNDEGPWICYRSPLRNGPVLPQPLEWWMEIRNHAWPAKFNWWIMYAFTSVLIKYPQVQLKVICSGTILIKTACRKVTRATLKELR